MRTKSDLFAQSLLVKSKECVNPGYFWCYMLEGQSCSNKITSSGPGGVSALEGS